MLCSSITFFFLSLELSRRYNNMASSGTVTHQDENHMIFQYEYCKSKYLQNMSSLSPWTSVVFLLWLAALILLAVGRADTQWTAATMIPAIANTVMLSEVIFMLHSKALVTGERNKQKLIFSCGMLLLCDRFTYWCSSGMDAMVIWRTDGRSYKLYAMHCIRQ